MFISYVRQDEKLVRFLAHILEINGLKVWLDKESLTPGVRWKLAIEQAIRNGMHFLSIHSKNREDRAITYANEELVVAIEELRKRSYGTSWFIPIKIDDCNIEPRSIGGGETILDLQICDLRNWAKGLTSLLNALGVKNPTIDRGVPLGDGLPSFVKLQSGFIRYDRMDGLPPVYRGMEFRIDSGWCQRQEDGRILAYIGTVAPFTSLQTINKQMGLSGFYAVSNETKISDSGSAPTHFSFSSEHILPSGSPMVDFASGQDFRLPCDVHAATEFVALGHMNGMIFSGSFEASLIHTSSFGGKVTRMEGVFEILFAPEIRAHGID